MLIFTYGTLRRGYGNHPLLGDSKYLGDARTEPKFTMLNMGRFPGLVASGETAVVGELYEVDEDVLAELDHLEGHPNFYRRSPITVIGDSGELAVQAYLLRNEWLDTESRIVASGDWANRNVMAAAGA